MDNILLLDLDGVLIPFVPWVPDKLHEDGYSDFDPKCVENLNKLLDKTGFDIVLSSTRRLQVDIDQMNTYFERRGVKKKIIAYVPNYNTETIWYNRRREIERFLEEEEPNHYLILDDDKSLLDADFEIQSSWIQTYPMFGFEG